jgi:hypothetical protein
LALAKATILIRVAFDIPHLLMMVLLGEFDLPELNSSALGTSIEVFSETHQYNYLKSQPK